MATVEELLVKIEADTKKLKSEMRGAEKSTTRFQKQANKSLNKFESKAKQSFSNAGRSAAIINGPLDGVAGRLSAIHAAFTTVNPAIIAFTVGIAGTVAIMTKAIRQGSLLERQMFKLEGLVQATGGAAGLTANQIDEMSRSIARNTLASSQGVRDAAGVLLTFKSVSGDVFQRTLELAQDMASVMGTDVKNATLQLAKALEEPTIGLTALRRSGVSFTEAEKEKIRVLNETNRTLEAQSLILDKVAGQLGGAAKREAQGLAGAMDGLSQDWEEFLEAVSDTGGLSAATTAVNTLASSIRGLRSIVKTSGQEQVNSLTSARESLKELQDTYVKGTPQYKQYQEQIDRLNKSIGELSDKRIEQQKAEGKAADKARELAEAKKAESEWLRLAKEGLSDTILADELAAAQTAEWLSAAQKEMRELIKIHETTKGLDPMLMPGPDFTDESGPATVIDLSAEQKAQLEKSIERMRLAQRTEEEVIRESAQNRLDILAQADNLLLEGELQRAEMRKQIKIERDQELETLEREHLARMGDLSAKGEIERMKFAKKTTREQAKGVLGELSSLTAGVAQENKALFEINKAASIATAIVNTYEGASLALAKYPGPVGFAMAAAHVAAGLAQVSAIASTSFGDKGGKGGAKAGVSGAAGAVAETPSSFGAQTDAEPRGQVVVQIEGNLIGTGDWVEQEFVPALRDALDNKDAVIFSNNSRQAVEVSGA